MDSKPTQRNFILGDSWLFYKIYTGPKTSDVVLTEAIRPIAGKLVKEGIIDKWFFIRYSDPKHHLRVRFHCNTPENIAIIINSLLPLLRDFTDKDLVWKIQADAYKRELERYGNNTMELAESLFFYDSEMIAEFLSMIEGDEGEELRWLFSLRAMDSLLDSFMYSEEEKLHVMKMLKTGFGEEFGMGRPLKKQLDGKYREQRKKIDEFMVFRAADNPDYAPILEILEQKKKCIIPVVQGILKYNEEKTLEVPLNDLMGSYIHMLMNRLFKSKNRMHEMVCYDFLYRYYRSSIARKQKTEVAKKVLS
ncbi:thiopeptide-type bacteriocin biosynthesis protein [Sinomicrobium sp. M5D2P9]